MPLLNNWFKEHSPADIVSKVEEISLAEISKWTDEELKRVGWTDNKIIDILYSLTSAGVWIERVGADGKQMIVDANTLSNRYGIKAMQDPMIMNTDVTSSSTVANNFKKRKQNVSFVSNAGGGIDTDPELVPALAGYYGVVDKIIVTSDGANTPVFEIQEGSTASGLKVSPGTLVANEPKEMKTCKYGLTDNTALSLDGSDCSDLGNAQAYDIEVHYHYET